ncbi:MAG: hypothetical protein QOF76_2837 [Solirubrobacteraceae bacterium]|nr:hypothetical protein [Solirubrobacteraceae bacterium]
MSHTFVQVWALALTLHELVDEGQGVDDAVTELARRARGREAQALSPRTLASESVIGGLFVLASIALVVFADADRSFEVGPALALVVCFAAGLRVTIDIGVFYTSPVQLAFVPMLLLLPTPAVPLLVLAGWFAGRVPDVLAGRLPADRLLVVPGDCWFALGPALVLIAGDAQTPDWGDWPIYLLALAAQFAVSLVTGIAREWFAFGTAPDLQLRANGVSVLIDTLFSPLGLLAAFACASFDYAFLLLLPPAAMLVVYARERTGRLQTALALADAAVERENLIAGASHELVTPVAVLVGLTDRLVAGQTLSPERRAQLDTVMRRETLALRQLVRQFIDYTRLKTDRELERLGGRADVGMVGAQVGPTSVPHDLPHVAIDPDRLHQVLTSLAAEAMGDVGSTQQAQISATAAGGRVQITVTGPAPPRADPFAEGGAEGLGLYVTAALVQRVGGAVALAPAAEGGSAYTLTLPTSASG